MRSCASPRTPGYDFDLLKGVITVNEEQFARVVDKIERRAGGNLDGVTVAVWGLTFKARTDDLRESPVARDHPPPAGTGCASIQAYDPAVEAGDTDPKLEGIEVMADPYAACADAEVLAVLTEWDEFKWLDFDKVAETMGSRRVVDARNLLDRNAAHAARLRVRGHRAGLNRWAGSSSPAEPGSSARTSARACSTGATRWSASTT